MQAFRFACCGPWLSRCQIGIISAWLSSSSPGLCQQQVANPMASFSSRQTHLVHACIPPPGASHQWYIGPRSAAASISSSAAHDDENPPSSSSHNRCSFRINDRLEGRLSKVSLRFSALRDQLSGGIGSLERVSAETTISLFSHRLDGPMQMAASLAASSGRSTRNSV